MTVSTLLNQMPSQRLFFRRITEIERNCRRGIKPIQFRHLESPSRRHQRALVTFVTASTADSPLHSNVTSAPANSRNLR